MKKILSNVLWGGILSLLVIGSTGAVAFAQSPVPIPILPAPTQAVPAQIVQTVMVGQTVSFMITLPIGMVNGIPSGATIDPVSGAFSWDTTGVAPGIYGFEVFYGSGIVTNIFIIVNAVPPSGTLFLSTTPNPDGTLSGTVTNSTIASTTSGGSPVISYIPAGTVVTGPSTWNGTVYPPTDVLPLEQQYTKQYFGTTTLPLSAWPALTPVTPTSFIEIGFGSVPLTFTNHAVRIVFVGEAGTAVGSTHDWSIFTPITNVCSADSQAVGDALLATPGSDCSINVGPDLVVWTTHFSSYTTTGTHLASLAPPIGSLVITKNTVGGNGTFSFTSSNGSSFSIATANGAGSYIIPDLAPGTYSVTEGKQPKGWKQTATGCSAVLVTAGNIASCTITDTKKGAQKKDKDGRDDQQGIDKKDQNKTEDGRRNIKEIKGENHQSEIDNEKQSR